MRNNLVFGVLSVFSFVLFACDNSTGGGSGGASSTTSASATTSTGTSGEGGKGGSGGMTGAGGANAGGAAGMGGGTAGMGGSGGGLPENAICGQSANGAMCGQGLVCCYPCGIPNCQWKCAQPCAPNTPGCSNGCPLLP